MATAPVKPQQLHNFPLSLKWGQTPSFTSHRLNLTPDSETESEPEPTTKPPRVGSRSARAHRFSFTILNDSSAKKPQEVEQQRQQKPIQHEEEDNFRPWKLRPRKETLNEQQKEKEKNTNNSSSHQFQPPPKSARLRGIAESSSTAAAAASAGGLGLTTAREREREKEEKRKFWISLSREEIEEDIFILTGSRPSRRPKKRPKNQQKVLDVMFPGLWLVGTTADSYRIADPPIKR